LNTPTPLLIWSKWSPNGKDLVLGGNSVPPQVWRVWQTTEELIAYAKECCVFRQLTPAERKQFGLPAAEGAQPATEETQPAAKGTLPAPTTPAPEVTPGAALPVISLGLLALALVWRRRNIL
jgi:hypothetical protein